MVKHTLAFVLMACVLVFALSGCSMEFASGASSLLGNIENGSTVSNETTVQTQQTQSSTFANTTAQQETDLPTTEEGDSGTTEDGETDASAQAVVTPENFSCKQLDIISGGTFYVVCARYDENNEVTTMTLANTADSVYMLMDLSGVPIGVLMKDGVMYMVYESEKQYIELNKVTLKLIGMDPDEMNISSISGAPTALPASCEEITYTDGEKATLVKYSGDNANIEIITRGDTLLEINNKGEGDSKSRLVFSMITDNVPEEKRSIPSSYEKAGVWSFFSTLASDMSVE